MTTVPRIFNFSAGPAVLPLPVLEEAREHLLALPGVGMSILEISHRSKPFEEICYGAEANLRKLAGVPDGYQVLFLQGGATLQFAMLAMNLLPAGGTADYIETGVWSEKAIADAKKLGKVHVAGELEGDEPRPHPAAERDPLQRGSGLRPHDLEQHDLRDPVASPAGGPGGGAAGQRRLVRHLLPAGRHLALRDDLRRGAEEPVDRRPHAGRRARGPARQGARDDAGLPQLRHPRQGALALQHAAGVRDLHPAPGAASTCWRKAASRRSRRGTGARRRSSTRRSTRAAATTAATPSRRAARG